MIYFREKLFIEKVFAALCLDDCDTLDISEENINVVIPLLNQLLIDKGILNETDELNLLFRKNCESKYTDVYSIIDNLDPLFVDVDGNDLFIIIDKNLAREIIKTDAMFKEDDIFDISKNVKNQFKKKNKMKELTFHAFN